VVVGVVEAGAAPQPKIKVEAVTKIDDAAAAAATAAGLQLERRFLR